MDNSAQYPYDAGYYLYSKKMEDAETNLTNSSELEKVAVEESVSVVTVVEYVFTNL